MNRVPRIEAAFSLCMAHVFTLAQDHGLPAVEEILKGCFERTEFFMRLTIMGSEMERLMFDIPSDVEFPMELAVHLKSKLHTVMEKNWHLKRHVEYLDKEVLELRKLKAEHQLEPSSPEIEKNQPSSLMASKVVELSKKNRDMTAQIESMKTKMKKMIAEIADNEKQRSLQLLVTQTEEDQPNSDSVSSTKADEGVISSSQQLAQLTQKMMEYRRQCQQLRLELRSALRALSQEVGEGVSPQNVLSMTNNNSWRGRQQQIIGLQQKVADMQIKLSNPHNHAVTSSLCSKYGHGRHGEGDSRSNFEPVVIEKSLSTTSNIHGIVSVTQPHRNGLLQQDLRKQEQIAKLTRQVEQMTQDLSVRQQDLKATKARLQILESQTKLYRSQIELLESKLLEKESESKSSWSEMNMLKQELNGLKDRENRSRDKSSLEIQEANRALTRERAIVVRLQQVISEKQEILQKSDGEVIELRNKLELLCSINIQGGVNSIERIQDLEMQLREMSDVISKGETKCQSLIQVMDSAIKETEEGRQKVTDTLRKSAKMYSVLQQADKCIDDCLDAAQITDSSLLQEVENIRTLMRELKTGNIYSLTEKSESGSLKKLRTKVAVLNKEVQILQNSLQDLAAARKSDLNNYLRLNDNNK